MADGNAEVVFRGMGQTVKVGKNFGIKVTTIGRVKEDGAAGNANA